jgi:S-adenosylmethionine hydrolase
VIDISHGIGRQAIREGAFLLWMNVSCFPNQTVHCAVVDPGVGTARKPLILRSGGQFFVGPDNGLLIPAARRLGLIEAFVITNERFFRQPVSKTFQGRDLFAPIAAHLANGFPPEELGEAFEKYTKLSFGEGSRHGSFIKGEIIFVDSFGNLVTNVSAKLLQEFVALEENLSVEIGARSNQLRFLSTYGAASEHELFITIGSHDQAEIAVNLGSAAQRLRARPGDALILRLGR